MADKITHCPFNHPIRNGAHVEQFDTHHHVVCQDCGAQGPDRETWAEALEAWNNRRKTDGHA